jgi:hypothetical protein
MSSYIELYQEDEKTGSDTAGPFLAKLLSTVQVSVKYPFEEQKITPESELPVDITCALCSNFDHIKEILNSHSGCKDCCISGLKALKYKIERRINILNKGLIANSDTIKERQNFDSVKTLREKSKLACLACTNPELVRSSGYTFLDEEPQKGTIEFEDYNKVNSKYIVKCHCCRINPDQISSSLCDPKLC